uniref:Uncharacterized protein n=1 Tax=Arundo donax TaxID=35708 RepID=A0A0A9BBY3_ARUDO
MSKWKGACNCIVSQTAMSNSILPIFLYKNHANFSLGGKCK